jgi:acyl carrier protein
MTEREQEVLDTINKLIRDEKGNRVTYESKLRDADLDSFGHTVLFLELDNAYQIFEDIPAGEDPFSTIPWDTITIKEVIEKCL